MKKDQLLEILERDYLSIKWIQNFFTGERSFTEAVTFSSNPKEWLFVQLFYINHDYKGKVLDDICISLYSGDGTEEYLYADHIPGYLKFNLLSQLGIGEQLMDLV